MQMDIKNPNNVQLGAKRKEGAYNPKQRRRDILEACATTEGGAIENQISMCSNDAKLIRAMLGERVIKAELGSGPNNTFRTRLSLTDVGREELASKRS